jgi:hypothetical protein
MLKISVTAESSADPQQVLESGGTFAGPKGRIAAAVNHTVAGLFWRPYLKGFLKKVEKSGA